MSFILALIALAAAYGCWHMFWSNAAFPAYVSTQLGTQWGPKAKLALWASVVFAIWGLFINQAAPSSVSLLISAITVGFWLASPVGQKFLSDLV